MKNIQTIDGPTTEVGQKKSPKLTGKHPQSTLLSSETALFHYLNPGIMYSVQGHATTQITSSETKTRIVFKCMQRLIVWYENLLWCSIVQLSRLDSARESKSRLIVAWVREGSFSPLQSTQLLLDEYADESDTKQ